MFYQILKFKDFFVRKTRFFKREICRKEQRMHSMFPDRPKALTTAGQFWKQTNAMRCYFWSCNWDSSTIIPTYLLSSKHYLVPISWMSEFIVDEILGHLGDASWSNLSFLLSRAWRNAYLPNLDGHSPFQNLVVLILQVFGWSGS